MAVPGIPSRNTPYIRPCRLDRDSLSLTVPAKERPGTAAWWAQPSAMRIAPHVNVLQTIYTPSMEIIATGYAGCSYKSPLILPVWGTCVHRTDS